MARANDESREDSGGGMNAMETLLLMAERCESAMSCHQPGSYPGDTLRSRVSDSTGYVSVVKFCGRPILPPVMTPERCEEMRQYRQQALMAETRLRARAKQKLLTRVQLIMAEIDDKHGTSSFATTSESDMTIVTDTAACHTQTSVTIEDTRQRLDSSASESSQYPQHVTETLSSPQHVDTVNCVTMPSPQHVDTVKCVTIPSPQHVDTVNCVTMPSPQHVDTVNCVTMPSPQHVDTVNCVTMPSPQHVNTSHCVTTPSPRRTDTADKHTPDSGISSKDPTRTTDNLPEETSAMLDTLADITNISSEEEDKEEEEEELLIRTMAGVKLLAGATDALKLVKASGSEVTSSPPSKIPVLVKRDSSSSQSACAEEGVVPPTNQQVAVVHDASTEKGSTALPRPVSQLDLPQKVCPTQPLKDQVTHPTSVAEKLSLAFQGQVARNQSQHAAGTSMKSSSSSGTTLSSDEMNQTVIAKSSLPHPDVVGTGENSANHPSVCCDSPQGKAVITGLLGKVALDSDTPEDYFQQASPGGAFVETDAGPVFNVEFNVHKKPMNIRPFPVDHHQGAVPEQQPISSESALAYSMAVTERTKSCDVSLLCTDSTELAAYMASNADSMVTSATTLPHLLDTPRDAAKCDTKSPVSQENMSDGKKKDLCENIDREGTSEGRVKGHVRQSSYTLEHPSPALLARTNPAPGVGVGGDTFELTSSMEDLRLKPVQRRLSYTDTEGGQVTAGTGDTVVVTDTTVNDREAHDTDAKDVVLVAHTQKTQGMTSDMDLDKENIGSSRKVKTVSEDGRKGVAAMDGLSGGTTTKAHGAGGKVVEARKDKHRGKKGESKEDGKSPKVRVKKGGRKETGARDGQKGVVTGEAGRDKGGLHDEREGKQEHLQRYLHTLSQMPPLPTDDDLPDPVPALEPTDTNSLVVPLDIEALTSLSEDDLLRVQQVYFERMREQLVQQQQTQLASLLAEQQKQQMLFQKEILAQEHDLLSQHRTSSDTVMRRCSVSTVASSKAAERNRSSCEDERKRRRRSHQETGRLRHTREYNTLDANGYRPSHGDYTDATSDGDMSLMSMDRVSTVGPLGPDLRPGSAPVPKVSFDMSSVSDEHRWSHTPERRTPRHRAGQTVTWTDASYVSPLVTLSRMSSPHKASTPRHHKSRPSPGCRGSRHKLHLSVDSQNIPADIQHKLEKMSAAVKGYLTRRLLASEKVQQIIKTIKDTAEFALNFQQESPIKKGVYSDQDRQLQARVLAQLTSAMYEIHEIFFELPVRERMAIIHMSRMLERERLFRPEAEPHRRSPGVTAATMKMMARKRKVKAAEKILIDRSRPKSAPPDSSWNSLRGPLKRNFEFKTSRALRPKHAMASPIKPTKDSINRLVARKQQTVPAKRRLLHSRVPPKATVTKAAVTKAAVTNAILTNAIGDGLQKKGSKVIMKRVTAVGGRQIGDGHSTVTTHHKVTIPRVNMTSQASRPKVKSVR